MRFAIDFRRRFLFPLIIVVFIMAIFGVWLQKDALADPVSTCAINPDSVYGAIGAIYQAWGGENGPLGCPTSPELGVEDDQPADPGALKDKYRDFVGGRVYWEYLDSETSDGITVGQGVAYVVLDRLLDRYEFEGGVARYGLPITSQIGSGETCKGYFQKGYIFCDGTSGYWKDLSGEQRQQIVHLPEPILALPFQGVAKLNSGPHEYFETSDNLYRKIDIDRGSGLDFGRSVPWNVLTMASGTIIEVCKEDCRGYGTYVAIRSEISGTVILYGHLGEISEKVKVGHFIEQGTSIGQITSKKVGGFSPHLHVELTDGANSDFPWGKRISWHGVILDGYYISAYFLPGTNQESIYNYDGVGVKLTTPGGFAYPGDRTRKHSVDEIEGWDQYFQLDSFDFRDMDGKNKNSSALSTTDGENLVKAGGGGVFTNMSSAQLEPDGLSQEYSEGDEIESTNEEIPYEARPIPSYPSNQSPPPSHCPIDGRPGVYFYSDINYSGSCFFSTENVSDFGATVLGDNELESVRIIGEWKAKLYKDRNYGGNGYEEINHSEPDINGRSLGGQVSSAKITSTHVDSNCEPTNRQGVYLYADKYYRGACHYTNQNIDNLGNTAVGDNNVSSAKVVGNYTIKLFEHPNQQGRSKEISRDDNDLDSESIGGMYSSMRIRPQEGSNLVSSINAPHGVSWQKCGKGDKVYMDRDYKFTGFSNSEYDGRWCITFPNDDKRNSSEKYVTFELNRPASVYVYFDRRMSRPPSWTGSLYNKNSKKVYTDDDDMDYFVVYSCKSHPGNITLGGPHFQGGDGAKAMYVVAFKEEQGGEQLCNGVRVAPTPTYTPTPTPTATPTFIPTEPPPISPTPTYTPTPVSPLRVVEDLNLATQNPAAGETVSVRFKVRNVSGRVLTLRRLGVAAKGPNCNEWDCPRVADWSWEEHLTIQPGQVFTFDHQRAFPDVGEGYFGQILFSLTDDDWNHIGSVQHFTVSPGLKVIEPLTLNPSNPRIGEQVTASYRVKNTGNRPISLRHLGVVAKGPDCNDWNCPRWADFPAVENITLQPGQAYLYRQQRSFSEAGNNYFADPAFGDHNGWWFIAPGGQRVNFNVSATLQLLEDLSISTQDPAAGETISARFRVKNISGHTLNLRRLGVAAKGPNCSAWDCPRVADWPWEEHLTLLPGQVFTFDRQRAFPDAGSGYFGQILFSLADNDWNHIGSERRFTVSQGLKVIQSLTLNPSSPHAGETVTARYKVKNTGTRPISLRYLGVVAKGPNCNDWNCSRWADFPAVENITLHPGQVYTYQRQRSFSEAGANYFADPAFGDHNGWWFFAPGGQRVTFSVSSAPSVTVTPSPTITPTAMVQPGEGFCWAFEVEDGLISGMDVVASQDASGNQFIRTIHPWSSDNVHFSVDVPATDDYYIWARARGHSWRDNSFFTAVDSGEQIHFEIVPVNETEWIWDWQRLYHDDGSFPHRLGIGEHTIRFTSREADAQLDAVIVSNDPDYIPTGMAECPTTVPVPTATPVPTDIIPPSGAFVEPAAEAEIGNPVWIRVNAQDDSLGSGIAEVIITSNGTGSWQVITADTLPPYEFQWDMRGVPNNYRFMIGAEIHDNAGNRTDIVRWVRSKSQVTALVNGDFEQGDDIGWQQHSSHDWQLIFHEDDANGPGFARSGSWEAWLGGDDDELSAITQQVTVPTDNPLLSFWYWSSSVDVCGYDYAGVLINNHEIDSFTLCINTNTNGWEKRVISLENYLGQAVDLEIRAETDGSLNSNLFIDDVALGLSSQNDSIDDKRGLFLDTRGIDVNKSAVLKPSPTVHSETDLSRVWTPSVAPK